MLRGVAGPAAAETYWQLTFSYAPEGLALIRAAQIQPQVKEVKTPGLVGALVRFDYDLQWLDAGGGVILATAVQIPLGSRCMACEGLEDAGSGLRIPAAGAFVIRAAGPSDVAGAEGIQLVRKSGGQPVAAPGGLQWPIPPAFGAPQQTFALPPAPPAAGPLAGLGPVGVVKLRDTGNDGNRLVVVMMGDGFTQAHLDAGSFANPVNSFLNYWMATSPWSDYQNLVNVYRVDIVSSESGVSYEDGPPGTGTVRDTYLRAGFYSSGTERCVYLYGNGVDRAFAAADTLVGAGVWDEILVFANSTKYGGCAGSVGVSSLHASVNQTEVHEFGHSFAGLADEYDYGSTSTTCPPNAFEMNVDCGLSFPRVKWAGWVAPGTPIPTPETSEYANAVGAFEGARYQAAGIYRPMLNCKMKDSGYEFCRVCKEQHVVALFFRHRIVDQATPAVGTVEIPTGSSRTFTVTPVNIGGLSYQWFLGGTLLPGVTGNSVSIDSSQVTSCDRELRMEVIHSTALVRRQSIGETNRWHLRVRQVDALTELFDGNDNDVAYQTFTFRPNSSANSYSVCREAATIFPTDPSAGTVLALGDDAYAPVTLTAGRRVLLFGRTSDVIYIGSNGYLTLDEGDASHSESASSHFSLPRFAALFDDLNPAAGGGVSWKEAGDRVAVTWLNVPEYGTGNANSFQIEMFCDGTVRMTFLGIDARDGLMGLSSGNGVPSCFVESDFTAYSTCLVGPIVYVDQSYSGPTPDGSIGAPFRTVTDAYSMAASGNIIRIFGGNYPEAISMCKTLRLESTNGPVRIGP